MVDIEYLWQIYSNYQFVVPPTFVVTLHVVGIIIVSSGVGYPYRYSISAFPFGNRAKIFLCFLTQRDFRPVIIVRCCGGIDKFFGINSRYLEKTRRHTKKSSASFLGSKRWFSWVFWDDPSGHFHFRFLQLDTFNFLYMLPKIHIIVECHSIMPDFQTTPLITARRSWRDNTASVWFWSNRNNNLRLHQLNDLLDEIEINGTNELSTSSSLNMEDMDISSLK